jgi:NAD(P)-dependent dehydrogenase (short-subunit alcohol dehydrogenase family)
MSSNTGTSTGRTTVITGAGRGIGRAEALLFAAQGSCVVVNDVDADAAESVVKEIVGAGGEAVANSDDVSDFDGAGRLIRTAVEVFGGLDTLVNNAGILRDRMFVNMSVEEWDAVIRVHLRGTFCPTKHATSYWRDEAKAGRTRVARIVNTSSPTGLYGNPGQANYATAKAGLAGLTQVLAEELGRYGVCVNAISPSALTDMTAGLTAYVERLQEIEDRTGWVNPGGPEHIVALVVWLGSPSAMVTGRVFNVRAGHVDVAQSWRPSAPSLDKEGGFTVAEIDAALPGLIAAAASLVDAYGRAKDLSS